ncbi:hypothetical protein [Vibrio owensii]|uniref:hypothetical protein n=1 Tax=Vibrio harveyi group TaxID=717610 RepID=UPI003CC576A4
MIDFDIDELGLLNSLCCDHLIDQIPALANRQDTYDLTDGFGQTLNSRYLRLNDNDVKIIKSTHGSELADVIRYAKQQKPASSRINQANKDLNHESHGIAFFNNTTGDAVLFDHPVIEPNFWTFGFASSSAEESTIGSEKRIYYRKNEDICELRLAPEQYIRVMQADTEVAVTLSRGYGFRTLTPPPLGFKPQVYLQNQFEQNVGEAIKPLHDAIDAFVEWIEQQGAFASKKKILQIEDRLAPVFDEYNKLVESTSTMHEETIGKLDQVYMEQFMKTVMNEVRRLPEGAQDMFDTKSLTFKK